MLNLKGFRTYSTFNRLLGFNILSTNPEYSFFFQLFLNDRNVIEGLFLLCLSTFFCLSAFFLIILRPLHGRRLQVEMRDKYVCKGIALQFK